MSLPFVPADVRFESPGLLLLLVLVAAAALLAYRRERATAGGLLFSSHSLLAGLASAPLEAGKPVPDGTAIGTGLATALTQLRISQAKAKVVILLTDGENNLGDISPIDAAQLAHVLGVHVYTIGAVPARGAETVDELLLKRMAELAGGRYFKVQDATTLAGVYAEV